MDINVKLIKVAHFACALVCSNFLVASYSWGNNKQCSETPYILGSNPDYDHLKYAPFPRERMYDGHGFISSVDGGDDDDGDGKPDYLVQPSFVAMEVKAYRSSRGSLYPPALERPRWYRLSLFDEDRSFYGLDASEDRSYLGSGDRWNRGHLAPRATINRISVYAGCNTHVYANAVPQDPNLNQGIWLALENYVSGLANEYGQVWDVSGPIFDWTKEAAYIGEPGELPIRIPDSIFKVIFIELPDGAGIGVLSFIFPNRYEVRPENYLKGNCSADKKYDLRRQAVSLSQIEAQTGLSFFYSYGDALDQYKATNTRQLLPISGDNSVGYCSPIISLSIL